MYRVSSTSYAKLKKTMTTIPKNQTSLSLHDIFSSLALSEIKEIFKLIPSHITHLDLRSIYFDFKKGDRFEELLAALPSTVTSLNLADNALGIKGVELETFFQALPRTITTLNLRSNHLYMQSSSKLVQAFKLLPPNLVSLNLSDNHFFSWLWADKLDPNYKNYLKFDVEKIKIDLEKLFEVLPSSITSLDLSDNYLECLTVEELIQAFRCLPPLIQSLNLSSNSWGDKNSIELKKIFETLPHTLVQLYLSLGSTSEAKISKNLVDAFKALPHEITDLSLDHLSPQELISLKYILKNFTNLRSLNLSRNFLSKKISDLEFISILKILPKALRHLNLESNDLEEMRNLNIVAGNLPPLLSSLNLSLNNLEKHSLKELELFFKQLPQSLQSLDLYGNNFGNLAGSLEKIVRALPASLVELNLGAADFYQKTTKQLATIFKALPPSLSKLNLSFNDLGERSAKELATIFKSLPESLESLNLRHNHIGEKTNNELKIIFQSLPKNLKKISFDNGFSTEQLCAIAEGLKNHRSLTKASGLSDAIEAPGVYAILERNYLALQNNEISTKRKTTCHGLLGFFKNKFKSASFKNKSEENQNPPVSLNC